MHQLTTRARAERWLAQPRPKPSPRRPSRLASLLLLVLASLLLTDAEKGEPVRLSRPAAGHRRAETLCLLGLSLLLLLAAHYR